MFLLPVRGVLRLGSAAAVGVVMTLLGGCVAGPAPRSAALACLPDTAVVCTDLERNPYCRASCASHGP